MYTWYNSFSRKEFTKKRIRKCNFTLKNVVESWKITRKKWSLLVNDLTSRKTVDSLRCGNSIIIYRRENILVLSVTSSYKTTCNRCIFPGSSSGNAFKTFNFAIHSIPKIIIQSIKHIESTFVTASFR